MKLTQIQSELYYNPLVKTPKFNFLCTSIYNYELETPSKVTQNIFLISRPISTGVRTNNWWKFHKMLWPSQNI